MINIQFDLLSIVVFILYFCYLYIHFSCFDHRHWFSYTIPLLLLLFIIQPIIKVANFTNQKPEKIVIDNSFSMGAVSNNIKLKKVKELAKQFSIPLSKIYNSSSELLDLDNISNWKYFSNFERSIKDNREIFITDDSNLYTIGKEYMLPFDADIEGLYGVDVAKSCYVKKICKIDLFYFIRENRNIVVEIPKIHIKKDIMLSKLKNKIEVFITMPYIQKEVNVIGRVFFKVKNKSDYPSSLPFVLSIRKAIAKGTFFANGTDLNSWRLSFLLAQKRYWKINRREFKHGQERCVTDFCIYLNYAKQKSTVTKPSLFIETKFTSKLNQNKNKNKKVHFYRWLRSANADSLFTNDEDLDKAINEFSKSLNSHSSLFYGTYLESGKRLYLSHDNMQNLYYFDQPLEKEFDYLASAFYYTLPGFGDYKFGKLEFQVGPQLSELSRMLDVLQNSTKKHYKLSKVNLQSNVIDTYNYRISFFANNNFEFKFQLMSIIILITLFIYQWYFYQNDKSVN